MISPNRIIQQSEAIDIITLKQLLVSEVIMQQQVPFLVHLHSLIGRVERDYLAENQSRSEILPEVFQHDFEDC
ncbi:hypothetical protein PT189_02765 [Erysipelothrix rhusiopathiae]|nr:hypothetical protein [Erysipelothrix rhusiopathiae]MDE8038235.1 hypothetical protein [Erysipelothrix rhusiopathiae]MDE8051237.1 hypothetical protein [Erysipelothrix rhusiopathiae]MDE8062185.1 hypothetical protein [Erysipelothrix rhusiopathiae]MDE8074080.1 hypothetical protein [Erysipelothrix rhusiopathiae]MDE8075693.1 hypothetical protein [Erysipelothrix rhusiopathiae]